MGLHIGLNARLPRILAGIAFQHGDDRFTLLIGDGVERLVHLIDGGDLLHDRMGGGERIEAHRRLAPVDAGQQHFPVGLQLVRHLGRHPAGKAFIQPQIVPPRHGDKVAEPLVRHFMRDGFVNAPLGRLRREAGIDQQRPFEREDRAPIFHRAEKLALARSRHIVELGQGEGHAEIVVEIGQDAGRRVERQLRLAAIALAGDDADFGLAGHLGGAFQFAQAKEQQIGRHFGTGAKCHAGLATAHVRRRFDRHVADRHQARGDDGAQVECRLVARLVPARHETARIGRFELGEQRALRLTVVIGIVEREKAVRLLVDDAGIGDGQPVIARRDRLAEIQADGLRLRIDRRLALDRPAARRGQRHVAKAQVGGVQHQLRHGLADGDVNDGVAGEAQVRRVGRHLDRVMAGRRAARQLGRDAGRRASGGGALRQRGRGKGDGGSRDQQRQDFGKAHGMTDSDTS